MIGRCDVCEAPTDGLLCSECDAKVQTLCDAHLARAGIRTNDSDEWEDNR